MLVNTSRFGKVEIDDRRIIHFSKGILGFPAQVRYVLLQPNAESSFYWLQCIDEPTLAFIVTDPANFVPTYRVPVKIEQVREMGLNSLDEAQVFVIVNRHGNTLTGNLQGPLVVDVNKRTGEQLVLSDRQYHPRVPLVEISPSVEAVPA